jgi:hypothetical protein
MKEEGGGRREEEGKVNSEDKQTSETNTIHFFFYFLITVFSFFFSSFSFSGVVAPMRLSWWHPVGPINAFGKHKRQRHTHGDHEERENDAVFPDTAKMLHNVGVFVALLEAANEGVERRRGKKEGEKFRHTAQILTDDRHTHTHTHIHTHTSIQTST